MFTQSQLETLHNLVNREIDRMYHNEVSYNRDILLTYLTHLTNLRDDIEKYQCFGIVTTVANLTEVTNES